MARLARRFAAGDEAAIRELHARYGARVLAAARRVVGDRRLAEDVAQETWLRAWRRAHTLDPRLPIEPWLFRIARNTAIDALRHAGRRPAGAPLERLREELAGFVEADVRLAELAGLLQRQREDLERNDPEALRVLEALGY